jgi:hypothetical protein
MMCLALGAMALTSCASRPVVQPIPAPFKEPCKGPNDPVATVGDLAVFSIKQEIALQDCEAKRKGLVSLIDQPKQSWWKAWLPTTSPKP